MAPTTALKTQIDLLDLLDEGQQEYMAALDLQRTIHHQVASGQRNATLIMLEHHPVYTAGKRTEQHERPIASTTPVIDVDRGGKITWHGAGQLVGYPIIKLRDPHELVGYVRQIEEGIIEILDEVGISSGRVDGRSGVWIDGRRKIAAIGIRVAQGVTMHGFAINVNSDLTAYQAIVPCGIADSEVTSISKEMGRNLTIANVAPLVKRKMLPILEKLS